MGSALASLGSAADFNSRQSSHSPRPLLRLSATVAAAAALLACDDRTPLTLVLGAELLAAPDSGHVGLQHPGDLIDDAGAPAIAVIAERRRLSPSVIPTI
jgi:hypothetical protein